MAVLNWAKQHMGNTVKDESWKLDSTSQPIDVETDSLAARSNH